MKNLVQLALTLCIVMTITSINGQSIWDGNGDGTSWDDPLNWSDDQIPSANAIVEIGLDATITGEMAMSPSQIKVNGKASVTFDMDMNVGSTATEEHAITIGPSTIVVFEAHTFNLTTANNKQGLANFASGDSAQIVIMEDAEFNFSNHASGVTISGPSTTFTNHGTLNFDNTNKTAVKSKGHFFNNGFINIQETTTDGILVNGGFFTNEEGGEIEIVKCTDDGIEIIDGGTFNNNGLITSTASDDANTSKNAIAIGKVDSHGYFINGFTGEISASGGIGTTARAISVYENGSLTNAGLISVTGGNDGASMYSKNEFTNAINGYINLNEGRININQGSFVNNGLMETTRSGAGIITSDNTIITNNAFFQYDSSSVFGTGNGMIVDNGFSLTQIYRQKIDAEGSCTVDLAEVAYDWFIDDQLYSSSMQDGTFTFLPNSLVADSVILTTTLPEVHMKVVNVCTEAVMVTATQDDEFDKLITISPSLVSSGQDVQINIDKKEDFLLDVFNFSGQLLTHQNIKYNTSISTTGWNHGQYIVRISNQKRSISKMLTIIK